ncbi:protein FAM210B, mitochondrial isoform X2 [Puntigrus tetrazona]|uniref:protein FAM210B, mitochondrial isoform X2 n=1 Tax=Puntigrus tetrazona TaxID=1606681 RepID=UPI001C8A1036|nr:protein FAM210B, mitochondrial isoform X2 [Puntigrus tetrazona]
MMQLRRATLTRTGPRSERSQRARLRLERREAGLHGRITDQLRLVTFSLVSHLALLSPSVRAGAMFLCRRNVSGAALLLRRLRVTLPDASGDCSRVHRRLTASKAVPFRSRSRDSPFGSPPDLVAHARMAAFSLNAAAPLRGYSAPKVEAFPHARSPAPVAIQSRRSSTTPGETRDERAADVQTDQVSSASGAEGQRSEEKPSKTQQLKKVFKEYGAVGVSFHIGISLISLGTFYLAVSSCQMTLRRHHRLRGQWVTQSALQSRCEDEDVQNRVPAGDEASRAHPSVLLHVCGSEWSFSLSDPTGSWTSRQLVAVTTDYESLKKEGPDF